MSTRTLASIFCWPFLAILATVLVWWWHGSAEVSGVETEEGPAVRGVAAPTAGSASSSRRDAGRATPLPAAAAGGVARQQSAVDDDRFWESVERHCPWPPEPSSWQVLDEPCLPGMNRRWLGEGWRRALDDPLAARHAVEAALDLPECHVPVGEIRTDLHDACAAEAMVEVALLQLKCAKRVRQDPEELFAFGQRTLDGADSQEQYHRRVEDERKGDAGILWEVYMCRTVPPEAHEWIVGIPEPEGDPASRHGGWKVAEYEEGSAYDAGVYEAGPMKVLVATSQHAELYAAARRLGAAPVPPYAPE